MERSIEQSVLKIYLNRCFGYDLGIVYFPVNHKRSDWREYCRRTGNAEVIEK
jgi:hypothetical protein